MELTEDGLIKSINVPYSGNNTTKAATNTPASQRKANPRDFLTEEILMASSTAKMAELVAKEIYNIRESKNALLRGQADNMPSDGAQLKIMLDNLNLQEEAMVHIVAGIIPLHSKLLPQFRILFEKSFVIIDSVPCLV